MLVAFRWTHPATWTLVQTPLKVTQVKSRNIPANRVPQQTNHHSGNIHHLANSACAVLPSCTHICSNVEWKSHHIVPVWHNVVWFHSCSSLFPGRHLTRQVILYGRVIYLRVENFQKILENLKSKKKSCITILKMNSLHSLHLTWRVMNSRQVDINLHSTLPTLGTHSWKMLWKCYYSMSAINILHYEELSMLLELVFLKYVMLWQNLCFYISPLKR